MISYDDLLERFWTFHNPCSSSSSRQYMSAIFYNNEEQRAIAEASKKRYQQTTGRFVATQIVPVNRFYLAEDYHQKYRLRQADDIVAELEAIYPRLEDFVSSTAVTRVNGYLIGYGSRELFEREAPKLGLSESALEELCHYMSRR